MSSLQLWLAVLGALVLAALVAHGAWQARRASAALRRDMAPAAGEGDAAPREPRFDEASAAADTLPDASAAAASDGPGEGTVGDVADADAEVRPVAPLAERARMAAPRIDALIDAIASLALEQPVSGDLVLAHAPASRRAGSKPLLIEGLRRDTGAWEPVRAGHHYSELQAAVQLANRHGALNEIEYSEFVQKIQAFGDAVGATPDFPDMLEVVARARELDAFAGARDAQLAMRLRAQRAAWPLPFVLQHAGRHGFIAGATPGRLVLPSPEEGAPPMLSLQFDPQAALAEDPRQARVPEITLAFDVPQTPPSDDPFNAWCAAGSALALGLDAVVSDDQGQPLRPEAFPTIGTELAELYATLAARDLGAGSPAARRLFS